METENNKEESNNEENNKDTEPYRAEAGSGQDRRIRTLAYEQPYKAVLKMGLPVAFGMLFMVAYNLVDTYFIGMLHNDYQLAGASLAYPVLMVMIAISGIVGNGGASYIARCMGAARQEEAEKTLMLGFEMILVMSLLLTVLGLLFLDPVVTLLGAREETFTYTRDYTGVLLLGSFFTMGNYAFGQLLRSEGSVLYAMISMIAGTVANIILDPVFIFTLDDSGKYPEHRDLPVGLYDRQEPAAPVRQAYRFFPADLQRDHAGRRPPYTGTVLLDRVHTGP